jgi:PRTRC genetic system protein E
VLTTVAKVDDKTLRVNVIPALAKADENPALTTPLTYTGPPEELDAELGKRLAGYVQTHQQTASTLAEAKATLEAAVPPPSRSLPFVRLNPRLRCDAVRKAATPVLAAGCSSFTSNFAVSRQTRTDATFPETTFRQIIVE